MTKCKYAECDSCINREYDPFECESCEDASNFEPYDDDMDDEESSMSYSDFVQWFKQAA